MATNSPQAAPLWAPATGAPNGVRFDGQVRWYWWGQDAWGADRIAARGRRAMTWDSAAACRQLAAAEGWTLDRDQVSTDPEEVLDLSPAQDWLARRVFYVDPVSGLNLWNWALDVAASTGQVFNPRSTQFDKCYDKLLAANVPYFFDLESYRPAWTPRQLRTLRRALGEAVHVIRGAGR